MKKNNKNNAIWDKVDISNNSSFNSHNSNETIINLFNENGIKDIKLLSLKRKKELFRTGVEYYKNGDFSLDELSELCEALWWTIKSKNDKFSDVLLGGSELSYYERNTTENETFVKLFIDNLKNVLSY